jgi:hypothetical protein
MPRSSSQASSTLLAISRLYSSETQNKYLDDLPAAIIPRVDGVMNRDVNKATIFLRANSKDAL